MRGLSGDARRPLPCLQVPEHGFDPLARAGEDRFACTVDAWRTRCCLLGDVRADSIGSCEKYEAVRMLEAGALRAEPPRGLPLKPLQDIATTVLLRRLKPYVGHWAPQHIPHEGWVDAEHLGVTGVEHQELFDDWLSLIVLPPQTIGSKSSPILSHGRDRRVAPAEAWILR